MRCCVVRIECTNLRPVGLINSTAARAKTKLLRTQTLNNCTTTAAAAECSAAIAKLQSSAHIDGTICHAVCYNGSNDCDDYDDYADNNNESIKL